MSLNLNFAVLFCLLQSNVRYFCKSLIMFYVAVYVCMSFFAASTPLRKDTGVFRNFGHLYFCVLLY